MAAAPRVTVFMPVHNRADLVGAAVESVLAQSYEDFELLVIDDGSTDETSDVLARYTDERLRVVPNSKNLGIPATRNRGLDLARGEYLAMLDSDDLAHPQRLARQVRYLDKHEDVAAVGSWAQRIDRFGRHRQFLRRPLDWRRLRARLLFMGTLRTPSVMGRTEILTRYRFRQEFPVCSDSDYWVRIALSHRCANVRHRLIQYRMHPGGITSEKRELVNDRKQAVAAYQLDLLGVPYEREDLVRHRQLRKPNPKQGYVSRELVSWAREWLPSLLVANQRVEIYPEPHFTLAVGEVWTNLCRWDRETGHLGETSLFDPALRHATMGYLTRERWRGVRYGSTT